MGNVREKRFDIVRESSRVRIRDRSSSGKAFIACWYVGMLIFPPLIGLGIPALGISLVAVGGILLVMLSLAYSMQRGREPEVVSSFREIVHVQGEQGYREAHESQLLVDGVAMPGERCECVVVTRLRMSKSPDRHVASLVTNMRVVELDSDEDVERIGATAREISEALDVPAHLPASGHEAESPNTLAGPAILVFCLEMLVLVFGIVLSATVMGGKNRYVPPETVVTWTVGLSAGFMLVDLLASRGTAWLIRAGGSGHAYFAAIRAIANGREESS